jgi:protein-S-isoprenylcysteine O-methyltransferase Ste14
MGQPLTTGATLKAVFFLLFAGLLAVRGYFGWRARQAGLSPTFSDGGEPEQKGASPRLLGIIIALSLLALLVSYAVSPGRWSFPLPGWLRWLGAALGASSLPLQVWVHATFEQQWLAAARSGKSHVLITQGPYRWVRHPLYAALMLFFMGVSLVSAFLPFLLLAFLSMPLLHRAAVSEEAEMRRRFGEEFERFAGRSGRFVPRLTRRKA